MFMCANYGAANSILKWLGTMTLDSKTIAKDLDSGQQNLVDEAVSNLRKMYLDDPLAYRKLIAEVNKREYNGVGSDLTLVDGVAEKASFESNGANTPILGDLARKSAIETLMQKGQLEHFSRMFPTMGSYEMTAIDKLEMSEWLSKNFNRMARKSEEEISREDFVTAYEKVKFTDGSTPTNFDMGMICRISEYFKVIANAEMTFKVWKNFSLYDDSIRKSDVARMSKMAELADSEELEEQRNQSKEVLIVDLDVSNISNAINDGLLNRSLGNVIDKLSARFYSCDEEEWNSTLRAINNDLDKLNPEFAKLELIGLENHCLKFKRADNVCVHIDANGGIAKVEKL